jgi:hypothetical protein
MKIELIFGTIMAVLALSPPVVFADSGYGNAVVSGLISGIISANAQPRQQTAVVEKRVVVHDRTVVHERNAAPTHKATNSKVKAEATVAPVPVTQPKVVTATPVVQPATVTPMPVTIVAATPVPTPNDRPTKSQAVVP